MVRVAFAGDDLRPYRLEESPRQGIALITFASICNFDRANGYEAETAELVDSNEALLADLSSTVIIGTPWLRWLGTLGIRARGVGKQVLIAGAHPNIRTTADALALGDAVVWVDSVQAGIDACA